MKKTIALIMSASTVMICSHAQAQTTSTTFGIRGGINFQNTTGKHVDGSKMTNSIIPGFNVGVNAEIPVAKDFYIQPGVLFTTKGAEYDKPSGQTYTSTLHLSYIEVPVNLVYKPLLGSGHLIAGFGPYVDFGVGGKVKYDGTGAPSDRKVKFQNSVDLSENNDNAYYRRVGAGANVFFGYEFSNKLSFQLNTDLGLTNISPDNDALPNSNYSEKNIGFGISAGYRF